jgi:hypothetical protein
MKHVLDVLENCNCQIGYTKYMLDVFGHYFLNDNATC